MDSYFNENVLEDIDKTLVLNPYFKEWYAIVEPILKHDEFQKRKYFKHHHNLSVWDHSILVSFHALIMAKFFHANERNCAIAGLLHDFYPQAWLYSDELAKIDDGAYVKRIGKKVSFFKQHGFVHAREAALNYVKFFPELENKRITNAIKRHMFPLNIIPPRYKEGFIITLVDKLNSCHELPSLSVLSKMTADKAKRMFVKKES